MAGTVQLKHPQTGIVKNGFHGLSWTTCFFGGLPALLRGDVRYGLGVPSRRGGA